MAGLSVIVVEVVQILLLIQAGAAYSPPTSPGDAIKGEDRSSDPLLGLPEAALHHHPSPEDAPGNSPPSVDTHEWVIKLKTTARDSYLGGLYNHHRTLDQSELSGIAASIADHFELEHAGHVTPFHGVFRLRYSSPSDTGKLKKRDGNHRLVEELERGLASHEAVVWAAKQDPLVRRKRGVAVDFNDPMFFRQWHLVSQVFEKYV